MGLRLTKCDEHALWQNRLAGGSACPTLAPVGQAFPPANRIFNGVGAAGPQFGVALGAGRGTGFSGSMSFV